MKMTDTVMFRCGFKSYDVEVTDLPEYIKHKSWEQILKNGTIGLTT